MLSTFYSEASNGEPYHGNCFAVHLDYVVLKFATDNDHQYFHRKYKTSFCESWRDRETQKIVAVNLFEKWKAKGLEDSTPIGKEMAAAERSKGLDHDYSLTIREKFAEQNIGTEISVAFAQHAALIRLLKHGWDSDKTARSLLLLFECIYKRNSQSKDLRPLLLLATDCFQKYFFNGKHDDARERCLFLRSSAALAQDDFALAANGYEELLGLREIQYGHSHLKAFQVRKLLAEVYGKQHNWDDALATYRMAYNGLKTILGEGNDETLAAKEGLAQALHAEGQYAEAESILRSIQQSSSNNSSDGVNKKLGRVYLDMASNKNMRKKTKSS